MVIPEFDGKDRIDIDRRHGVLHLKFEASSAVMTIRYSTGNRKMALVIYDLDETLITADCSSLWIRYMVEKGIAPKRLLAEEARLGDLYARGRLDIDEQVALLLSPHLGMTLAQLAPRVEAFVAERVLPHVSTEARANIRAHRAAGDRCMVISASVAFLVRPIAARLGIADAIGIDVETGENGITGRISGTPSFRGGKVVRLMEWVRNAAVDLEGSWFYSDSHNDLALLERVTNPVVINGDPALSKVATARGWPRHRWRTAARPAPDR